MSNHKNKPAPALKPGRQRERYYESEVEEDDDEYRDPTRAPAAKVAARQRRLDIQQKYGR